MDTVQWRDEHQSVRRTHREAKQTGTPDFGAEKDLLQGHARRLLLLPFKAPRAPRRVLAKHFEKPGFGGGGVTRSVIQLCTVL